MYRLFMFFQSSSADRIYVREQFDQIWADLNDSTKTAMGHQKSDMILDCVFNGEKCSAE